MPPTFDSLSNLTDPLILPLRCDTEGQKDPASSYFGRPRRVKKRNRSFVRGGSVAVAPNTRLSVWSPGLRIPTETQQVAHIDPLRLSVRNADVDPQVEFGDVLRLKISIQSASLKS